MLQMVMVLVFALPGLVRTLYQKQVLFVAALLAYDHLVLVPGRVASFRELPPSSPVITHATTQCSATLAFLFTQTDLGKIPAAAAWDS